jgi:hypothetical protein
VGQRRGVDPDASAYFLIVRRKIFVSTYKIHKNSAVKILEIICLQFYGGIDVVLIRTVLVELPPYEGRKVGKVLDEVRSLPAEVVPGTDLKIPGVPHEGEFKKFVEKLPGEHLFGGNDLRMAWQFAGNAVTCHVAKTAGDELGYVQGVSPSERRKGRAYTRSPCFGNVNKEEIVFYRQQHALLSSDGVYINVRSLPGRLALK